MICKIFDTVNRLSYYYPRYYEFSKDIEKRSKTDIKPLKPKKFNLEAEEEANQVEELDRWEKNNNANKKLRETMIDPYSPQTAIRHKTLPPIIKGSHTSSQSSFAIPKQTETVKSIKAFTISPEKLEENLKEKEIEKEKDEEVEFEDNGEVEKEEGSIVVFQENLGISPDTGSIAKINDEEGEEDDKMENLMNMVEVMEENEGLEEVRHEIQRMFEGDEDYDVDLGGQNGFSLKNLANYYKDINEQMENRVSESIKQIQKALQENKEMVEKITEENIKIEEEIDKVTKKVKFYWDFLVYNIIKTAGDCGKFNCVKS